MNLLELTSLSVSTLGLPGGAYFGKTVQGYLMLWHGNYGYFREKQKHNTTNWKCSCYTKHHCKARAVTKEIGGEYYFRITCDAHTHPPFNSSSWPSKRKNDPSPLTSVVYCNGRW